MYPPPLKRLPPNTKGRDFVVGDLHGHYDLLRVELGKVSFNAEVDRLFSVGDLVDRGPKNVECLMLTQEPWFHAVVGNHEDMMFEVVLGQSYAGVRNWIPNGGDWWDKLSEPERLRLIPVIKSLFESMPLAIEIQQSDGTLVGICHAEPPSVWSPLVMARECNTMMWSREHVRYHDEIDKVHEGVKAIYMGHTPLKEARHMGPYHWIDTGAFATGRLTLMEIT